MPYVSNREPCHSTFKSVIEMVVPLRGLHRDVERWCKRWFDELREYMDILTGVGFVVLETQSTSGYKGATRKVCEAPLDLAKKGDMPDLAPPFQSTPRESSTECL